MVQLFLFSVLLSTSVLTILGQTSDTAVAPISSSVACPVQTEPPSTAPHQGVAVSPGLMAKYRTGGKDPKYPSDAKRAHVEGRVVLVATVSPEGRVEDLCVSQGPEMLRQAAYDAVKTWRYKPFEMNGKAVEVKTMMNVDFALR